MALEVRRQGTDVETCRLLTSKDRDYRERVTGIEPAWPAWKAGALPLSYTRASEIRLRQV